MTVTQHVDKGVVPGTGVKPVAGQPFTARHTVVAD
jgi:hypothetical protein